MNISKNFLLLFILIFSGCNSVKIPDIKFCSVAGSLSIGMDCATTISKQISEINTDETIIFLENGAVCSSSEDFTKMKIALEQACKILKNRCAPELRQLVNDL